jgi:hypothetical protein
VTEQELSDEIRRFIADEIHSVEQLEILLLMSGEPPRAWSVDAVYSVVRSSPESIRSRLEGFADRRIVTRAGEADAVTYRFAPAEASAWAAVSALREAYRLRSVKVIEAIYSRPPSALEEFAKAFTLKRDK